jgi:hypothetical protein
MPLVHTESSPAIGGEHQAVIVITITCNLRQPPLLPGEEASPCAVVELVTLVGLIDHSVQVVAYADISSFISALLRSREFTYALDEGV